MGRTIPIRQIAKLDPDGVYVVRMKGPVRECDWRDIKEAIHRAFEDRPSAPTIIGADADLVPSVEELPPSVIRAIKALPD